MNANPTFLVLEDLPPVRNLICNALEDYGYQVVAECHDAKSTLEAIANNEVDICLLDINLGDNLSFEGIRVAEEIRKINPTICMLFLSAYAYEDIIFKRAVAISPQDILKKPSLNSIDKTELIKKIELAWHNHQNKNFTHLQEIKNHVVENADFITVKPKGTKEVHTKSFLPVYFADILYAESKKDYVHIFMRKSNSREEITTEMTLTAFAEKCLASKGIRRIHDSFVFNFAQKEAWSPKTDFSKIIVPKEVYGITEISIGKTYIEELKLFLGIKPS